MRHLAMLGVLLLAAIGCRGNSETSTIQAKPPEPLSSVAGEWMGHNGGDTLKLWLAKSGPFVAIGAHDGVSHTAKGEAEMKDGKVILNATEFDGKPPTKERDKEPAVLTLSADGKTLTSKDGVVMTRR